MKPYFSPNTVTLLTGLLMKNVYPTILTNKIYIAIIQIRKWRNPGDQVTSLLLHHQLGIVAPQEDPTSLGASLHRREGSRQF
jgi:hypothetical protein